MTFRSMLRAGVIAALAALAPANPAFARDVTEAEKLALQATIGSFDAAMRANEMDRIMATVPPSMLTAMAAQFEITEEQLIAAAGEQMEQAMASVTLVSFGMDFEATVYAELSDGTPYALIPTETIMEVPGSGKVRAAGDTLGIIENDTWYLMRIDAGQLPLLHQVYPGFAEVELNPGTMEPVE